MPVSAAVPVRSAARAAGEGREPDADLFGFGGAELGVEVHCCPEVAPGLILRAGCLVGAGQAMVRASPLVQAAGPFGQLECGGVLAHGVPWSLHGHECFPQAIARLGFATEVAAVLEQGGGLLMMLGGLLVAAQVPLDNAEPGQRLGFTDRGAGSAGA